MSKKFVYCGDESRDKQFDKEAVAVELKGAGIKPDTKRFMLAMSNAEKAAKEDRGSAKVQGVSMFDYDFSNGAVVKVDNEDHIAKLDGNSHFREATEADAKTAKENKPVNQKSGPTFAVVKMIDGVPSTKAKKTFATEADANDWIKEKGFEEGTHLVVTRD